jgi:hypothetical protein
VPRGPGPKLLSHIHCHEIDIAHSLFGYELFIRLLVQWVKADHLWLLHSWLRRAEELAKPMGFTTKAQGEMELGSLSLREDFFAWPFSLFFSHFVSCRLVCFLGGIMFISFC